MNQQTNIADAVLGKKIHPDEAARLTRERKRAQRAGAARSVKRGARRRGAQNHRQENERQNMIGVARVYLNVDGAHERSPQVAKNATKRVHDIADAISQRDGIPWTQAIKIVEGELMKLVQA